MEKFIMLGKMFFTKMSETLGEILDRISKEAGKEVPKKRNIATSSEKYWNIFEKKLEESGIKKFYELWGDLLFLDENEVSSVFTRQESYNPLFKINEHQKRVIDLVTAEITTLTPDREKGLIEVIEEHNKNLAHWRRKHSSWMPKEELETKYSPVVFEPEKMVDVIFRQWRYKKEEQPNQQEQLTLFEKPKDYGILGSSNFCLVYQTRHEYPNRYGDTVCRPPFAIKQEIDFLIPGVTDTLVPAIIPYDAIKQKLNTSLKDSEVDFIRASFFGKFAGQGIWGYSNDIIAVGIFLKEKGLKTSNENNYLTMRANEVLSRMFPQHK
jgi:hypothetical protein